MKINRIRASMITTLSVFIENIYNCYIVLWRNDTPPLSPNVVHPQISSSLRLLVLCLVRPDLFVIYYCLFICFKELISFIGSLDKCHISVFHALVSSVTLVTSPIHLSMAYLLGSPECHANNLNLFLYIIVEDIAAAIY